jgi:hypothetical protein
VKAQDPGVDAGERFDAVVTKFQCGLNFHMRFQPSPELLRCNVVARRFARRSSEIDGWGEDLIGVAGTPTGMPASHSLNGVSFSTDRLC